MGILVKKGEVVVLPFPFTDFKTEKRRPALVILVPRHDEVILCQITKESTRPEYQILLTKSDFAYGCLEVDPCYLRPNHIFTADPEIIDYSEGQLKPEKVDEVIEAILQILIDK
jgi:mRNA-degrading endonuclease toxin of MazEF toxin-antitoxin module